jgi:hypothetical protein
MRHELPESWTIGADFYRSAQDINLLANALPDVDRVMRHRS